MTEHHRHLRAEQYFEYVLQWDLRVDCESCRISQLLSESFFIIPCYGMQKLHVRNIFTLVVPLHSKEVPSVRVNTTSANFGLTLTYPSNLQSCHYRIALFSNFRTISGLKEQEEAFTALLQWAKQIPFSFKNSIDDRSIEAIELHLRIGPGFDFRKVPKRYVRFEIECFASGTFQCKASSQICEILGKRRTAHASDIEAGKIVRLNSCLLRKYFCSTLL